MIVSTYKNLFKWYHLMTFFNQKLFADIHSVTLLIGSYYRNLNKIHNILLVRQCTLTRNRSSRSEVFYKKDVFRNFAKIHKKTPVSGVSFLKSLLAESFIGKDTWTQLFSWNIFFLEHLWWLHLWKILFIKKINCGTNSNQWYVPV